MVRRASYEVETVIGRPAGDVLAFLSDLRNEMSWNPDARSIVKVTDGPICVGTQFEAQWRNTPRTLVEIEAFDPPRRWGTRSRSLGMDVVFTGVVASEGAGARYTARLEVSAAGIARLLLPLAVRAMRHQDEEHMRRIVAVLDGRRETSVRALRAPGGDGESRRRAVPLRAREVLPPSERAQAMANEEAPEGDR
jgi:hypothetical protein